MTTTSPLAIPLGDPAGIGPEICLRFIQAAAAKNDARRYVFVGDEAVWRREADRLDGPMLPRVDRINPADTRRAVLLDSASLPALPAYGTISAAAGAASYVWVETAVRLALDGTAAGVVTPPIHKEAWHAAGIEHAGHTEALRAFAGADRGLMFFVGRGLRIGLATVHVPLSTVPGLLRAEDLTRDLVLLRDEAARWFGMRAPRIAVCGLNPHAGEGGLLGHEDADVIAPAVEAARAQGVDAIGPLPADACIPAAAAGRYDMVLAMYHDQGLTAIKTFAPRESVNVTLGLPFLRTSVDHGTAFDIAGSSTPADDMSLRAAIDLAWAMAEAAANVTN